MRNIIKAKIEENIEVSEELHESQIANIGRLGGKDAFLGTR